MPDEVLIIGAGAAGLAAAGVLERAGLRAVILEARERMGGRIHTVHPSSSPVPVELGAEFIHGRPAEIWEHIDANQHSAQELKGERCYFENGRIGQCGDDGGIEKVLSRMTEYAQPDRSFAQYLEEACRDVPEREKAWAVAYVEGFNAARKEEISVRSLVLAAEAAERGGGEALSRFTHGYDSLVASLYFGCRRAELRLGTVVESLRWQPGAVRAKCNWGAISGKCAIVTLPLGVLQAHEGEAGYVRFDPEPQETRAAARRLRMGQVVRIILEFRQRFWDWGVPTYGGRLPEDLAILFSLDAGFPTWWTSHPVKAPVLTGWKPRGDVHDPTRVATESLARLLGVPANKIEPEIVTAHRHDWQSDPFTRGAYSYVPAGCVDDVSRLARPVENTLFFAGEATHESGRNGTVDGAIATGRRAAEEVIALRRSEAW